MLGLPKMYCMIRRSDTANTFKDVTIIYINSVGFVTL